MNTTQLLQKLVSIPSASGKEQHVSRFIEKYVTDLGFKVKRVYTNKTRPNLVATFGTAKKHLAFYGHMDTVPAAKDYEKNPYKMWIEKNNIARGLGVCDMKGGISVILKTAEFAAKNKLQLKLIFGVDEEEISQGAHDLVTSRLLDDINFIVAAESGQVRDYKQAFSVCYGRKGRILFDIIVKGKKAHAAESHKGVNALEKAALLINEIKKIRLKKDAYFGVSDIVFQKIESESDSFSIPDTCIIQCSLLTNSVTKSKDFIMMVKKVAAKLKLSVDIQLHTRPTPYGESYAIDKTNSFFKKIEQHIIKPSRVVPIYTESVADENVFANRLNIPVLTMGNVGGGDHTSSEWVSLDSLPKLEAAYIKIVSLYNNFI